MIHIAQQHFTPDEFRRFGSLTGVAQQDVFFALWTRKEAIVKVLGHGLGVAADDENLRSPHEGASASHHLSVTQLFSLPGYFAAVATLQLNVSVMEYTWNDCSNNPKAVI